MKIPQKIEPLVCLIFTKNMRRGQNVPAPTPSRVRTAYSFSYSAFTWKQAHLVGFSTCFLLECPPRLCPGLARKSMFVNATIRISVSDFITIKQFRPPRTWLHTAVHTPASTCRPTARPTPPRLSMHLFNACRLIHDVRVRRKLVPYWRRGPSTRHAVGGAWRSDPTHDQSEASDKPRTALYRVPRL